MLPLRDSRALRCGFYYKINHLTNGPFSTKIIAKKPHVILNLSLSSETLCLFYHFLLLVLPSKVIFRYIYQQKWHFNTSKKRYFLVSLLGSYIFLKVIFEYHFERIDVSVHKLIFVESLPCYNFKLQCQSECNKLL